MLSNLSAAYLARAARDRDPRDLIRALEAAERAVQLDPDLAEARWNRAVALEAIVRRPAIEAWRQVISTESDPAWRTEAEARVARLAHPTRAELWRKAVPRLEKALDRGDSTVAGGLVAEHLTEIPAWFEDRLLLDWLPARQRSEDSANRLLAQLAEVAGLFAERTGDSLTYKGIRELLERPSDGDVRALEAWRAARVAFAEADYGTARLLFHQARRGLAQNGNPLATGLLYWEARCLNRSGDFAAGSEQAAASLEVPAVAQSGRLAGRLGWVVGSAQSALGLDSAALASFRAARARLEGAGDVAAVASVEVRLAGSENEAGRALESWRHRFRALELFDGREDDPEFGVALAEAIYGAQDLDAPLASLALQNEEVRVARESQNALSLSLALRHRADFLSALDSETLERSLAEARAEAGFLATAEARERTLRQIDFVEAGLIVERDPRRAWRMADQAVASFEVSAPTLLPSALRVRAQARRDLSDLEGSAEDLALAMEKIEALRDLRQGPSDRAALVTASSAIYEDAISLALERHQATAALDIAERARSRALLDWLGLQAGSTAIIPTISVRPKPFAELRRCLPSDRSFIEYFVGRKELVVWLVRSDQVRWFRLPVGRQALRDRVAETGRAKSSDLAATDLSSLYDLLIRPLATHLVPGEPLQIVADDALLSVGFAGLLNRDTGRFLIEDHPLVFSPSLNAMAKGVTRKDSGERTFRLALVVADPEFNRELFPSLRRLPESRKEGIAIGEIWPSIVLTGKAATPGALLAALPGHDLLHIGAHAEVFAELPLGSRLLLAPDPPRDEMGTFSAEALLGADLRSIRLVVIAACGSAGRASEEGAAGLAWPLLARGVPEVVATVRPVEDVSSARMMDDFYRSLMDGSPRVEALRRAQIRRLADTHRSFSEVRGWAAFKLFTTARTIP